MIVAAGDREITAYVAADLITPTMATALPQVLAAATASPCVAAG
jgi:hypothetical protein